LALSASGRLPYVEHMRFASSRDHGVCMEMSMWCQALGLVALFVGLFLGQDIAKLFKLRTPTVFLDRTCVCQTDPVRKRKGIEALAAILSNSRSIVVLYSDVYLQKLWTVYEVATFLFLHPQGKLKWLPVIFPKVVFSGLVLVSLSRLCLSLFSTKLVQDTVMVDARHVRYASWLVRWALMLPCITAFSLILRQWAKQQALMKRRLRKFTIAEASCLEENDREIIMGNVAVFAKYFRHVEPTATEEEALAEFDKMIHTELPRLLLSSLGPIGIPYRYSVVMFSVYLFYALDHTAGIIRDGWDTEIRAETFHSHGIRKRWHLWYRDTLFCIAVACFVGPLAVALCSWLSSVWRKSCSGAVSATIGLIVTTFYFLSVFAISELFHIDSSWSLAIGTAAVLAYMACALLVYRPCRRCRDRCCSSARRRRRRRVGRRPTNFSASSTSSESSNSLSDDDSASDGFAAPA